MTTKKSFIKIDVDAICVFATIIFAFLKLMGFVDWSWWVVTAPIWFPLAVCSGVVLVLFLLCGIKIKEKL